MKKCVECEEEYEADELAFGLCEDCQADFDDNDAEYQLEKALHYADKTE